MNTLDLRDEVLANVAHDIRSPLATIALAATKLAGIAPADAESIRSLDIINRATSQIDALVSYLLEVAAIEGGVISLHVAPTRVCTILEEVAGVHRQRADAAGISLVVQTCTDGCMVTADRERIIELLGNLAGNALKFTPIGGTVTLSCDVAGDEVTIAVKDTGVGIPASQIAHVFDRFWQANPGRSPGAGLGLSICKGIADAHRGRITVSSEVGIGSIFHVVLPAAVSTDG